MAEIITNSIFFIGILEKKNKANGSITMPAEKIRSDAIWAHVSSSLLAFISMNELPQIIHNKINIPQLKSLSFFIMMRKGH